MNKSNKSFFNSSNELLTDSLKKINIKKIRTFEEINEFCLDNSDFCINNKEKICKQLIKIADIEIIVNDNYCENFNQYLQLKLSEITIEDDLVKFSKLHPEFSYINKKLICKQILIINKYNVNNSFNQCNIYSELLKLAKMLGNRQSTYNRSGNIIIKMSHSLLELCKFNASSELRRFLIFNKYLIDPSSNLLSDLTEKYDESDMSTLKL